LTILNQNAIFI